MYRTYAIDPRARINLGIRRRLAPLMENDPDRVKLMNSLLLSMPGSPIIYYGDEIGMGDNVFLGDRNGVRTPMQWSPDRNAGFSRADPQRLYLPPIMDAMYGYEALNVEAQSRDLSSLLNWTKRMLAVRQTSHAFGRGERHFLSPGNRKVLAYLREHDDDSILCVCNLSRSAQPVELELSRFKGRVPVEMLGRTAFPPIGELPYLLTLPGYGFYWFRLTVDAEPPRWHEAHTMLEDQPVLVLFDGWSSLFRERVMPWRIGMAERLRLQFETEALPRYIEAQRWYATKGTTITRARLADHVQWDQGDRSWLLPLVDLEGPSERSGYFVPLALAWEDHDEERLKNLTLAALAKVRQQANIGVMGDAFADEVFCRAVVAAIGAGLELPAASGRLHFRPTAAYAVVAGSDAEIDALPVSRPLAQSSNTIVMLGEKLFLKGYRRLRGGVNPELEVGRHLTDVVHYPHCVPIAGALEYTAANGVVVSLALVQAFVANQGDGWSYTLAYLERFFEPLRTAAETVPPDVHGAYLALVQTLGVRTAELHVALARATGDAAFDPEPLAADDLAALRQRAVTEAQASLALLRARVDQLADDAERDEARGLLQQQERVQARIAALAAAGEGGVKIRYHGDYHLGQVLVTRNDFVIIDFEGEPARSFEERRAKGSALRDVAGMLRSFNYAHWSALRRVAHSSDELDRLAPHAQAWEQQTRTAFLAGYRRAVHGTPLAVAVEPGSGLLGLFELEKALYELRYELGNRPDWVSVPLQGIKALLGNGVSN
jgi:maltose alpha-D-glucosyltransferase/alpha-amylase